MAETTDPPVGGPVAPPAGGGGGPAGPAGPAGADAVNGVASTDIDTIVVLTQAAYNALAPANARTYYLIVG